MVDLIVLEMAAARQRVKRAELSVKQAKTMLDDNHGIAISLALCSRIRAGQARESRPSASAENRSTHNRALRSRYHDDAVRTT
ncbi:hypothetical protein C7I87_03005 [Mesorhizobium sp. SARCC-RB16n]|uniref:hypothetical protein n=1 Tax=Mesorhizobium sp. SARCC-RB16n TaxID=2116687 RepID=UPI00122F440E|nr:hypothetical protein [Mesorhizobium sp. SARCC-RB16n]KAA3452165.1 hypothetical protein C7I87_03005 [Mesorhizobium sp. SARCC-RB16n]